MAADDNFYFSQSARLITISTASISTLSSMLIMSIILRSRGTRTSSYHLIMFVMSFWDAIASAGMALTTAPMPSDVHEIYPFEGKAYGNAGTCTAQGLLIVLGDFWVVFAVLILHLFYLAVIRYGVAEEAFKRRGIPIFLLAGTGVSIALIQNVLQFKIINPTPRAPFCAAETYPAGCNEDQCIRGMMPIILKERREMIRTIVAIALFTVTSISLVLVLATVFDMERSESPEIESGRWAVNDVDDELPDDDSSARFKNTKVISLQTLMYIVSLVLAWIWPIIDFFGADSPLKLVFMPLFGFYNAVIFIYQKMYVLRQSVDEMTFYEALKKVIMAPHTVPEVLFTKIEIVGIDNAIIERQQIIDRMMGRGVASEPNLNADVPNDNLSRDLPSRQRENREAGMNFESISHALKRNQPSSFGGGSGSLPSDNISIEEASRLQNQSSRSQDSLSYSFRSLNSANLAIVMEEKNHIPKQTK